MESFLEAWDLICDYCKKQVTDVSYETWFSKLVPISLDFGAGVAIIQAPNGVCAAAQNGSRDRSVHDENFGNAGKP